MKYILYLFFCGLLASVLLLGCKQGGKTLVSASNPNDIAATDSVDILIAERAEREINSTIFAGLRFGDNPNRVNSVLQNPENRTIYIPIGDRVDSVIIRDYDATYYKEQLDWLRLYANEDRLVDSLETLFSKKYGLTKHREWRFSD